MFFYERLAFVVRQSHKQKSNSRDRDMTTKSSLRNVTLLIASAFVIPAAMTGCASKRGSACQGGACPTTDYVSGGSSTAAASQNPMPQYSRQSMPQTSATPAVEYSAPTATPAPRYQPPAHSAPASSGSGTRSYGGSSGGGSGTRNGF